MGCRILDREKQATGDDWWSRAGFKWTGDSIQMMCKGNEDGVALVARYSRLDAAVTTASSSW
jgi:hypothetical protein